MQSSLLIANAKHCLNSAKGKSLSVEHRRELAIELAGHMLNEARRCQTHRERRSQTLLAHMMKDIKGKTFTTALTDQCFRSKISARVADQLNFLINKFGIPHFLPLTKKIQLSTFYWLQGHLSGLTVPIIKHMLRKETAQIILPGESEGLARHMKKRRKEDVRINLNRLGEAILGEEEAKQRLNSYLNDLANPNVEYISVKISTIFSQINLLSWEETLATLSKRLKSLYRTAKENFYVLPDGKKVPKFVNLDMEEYRDLNLTVELFRRVLNDAQFYDYSAGIVLQSYLPDSFLIQKELTAWAMQRVASGGAPIKIRLVKGANLAMEKVEASLKGWAQAPYLTKGETDANFKRMLTFGCNLQHAQAVHLGVASHNLFDIAYAMLLRIENGVEKYVGFEMLEGMADHIRRVVQALAKDMLLYCPVATKEEFQNAVAYLMRRLDENTAPENFLCHSFEMLPGTKEWQSQSDLFSHACHTAASVSLVPRRQQNRQNEPARKEFSEAFANEPDTDWSLMQNRKWAETIVKEWSSKQFERIPLVLGNSEIFSSNLLGTGEDPSFPGRELYQYAQAEDEAIENALVNAEKGFKIWSEKPLRERLLLIDEIAHQLRLSRKELIGAMIADAGKTITEADIEVSEAIDFAEYYRRSAEAVHFLEDLRFSPKGPVLIAPPWNFPCSIPAGGILAALTTGNSVIFKPAPETVFVGWTLAKIFWRAGIGKEVLQFLPCQDEPYGSRLIRDPRIAAVVLTGSTATAKNFLKLRPDIDLFGETGGKNSLIVTNLSDRDLAIKDLIYSAFGHAGQKCSACSLAILEKEVYDDLHFRRQLRDAAASLHVGSQWDLSTSINPLIRQPQGPLLRGLTTLEEGEEWLLEPKPNPKNGNLWSPGIKLGVKPGSFTHKTELFGPVLGIMRAENLAHAISLANATPYGLTAGLHSLDEREQEYWIKYIEAGNCYINRGITGAIVRRQPFGGCKESSFGPGAKAGGPNYLLQLMKLEQKKLPKEREPVIQGVIGLNRRLSQYVTFNKDQLEIWNASIGSYAFFWNHYFSKKHDPSLVLGQDNFLLYVPRHLTMRIQAGDSLLDILRIVAAALTCRSSLELSTNSELAKEMNLKSLLNEKNLKDLQLIKVIVETDAQHIDRLESSKIKRMRLLSAPNSDIYQAIANSACTAIIAPVFANGRIELLHFLREVSLSINYHRYGYLGTRENEKRFPQL